MNRSVIKAAGIAVLVFPLATGCYIGPDAGTQTQGNSGNGATVSVDGMEIVNATLVAGDPDSGKAAFLGSLYNPTDQPDQLIAVTADGVDGKLMPKPLTVPAGATVTVKAGSGTEADFTGLEAESGTYTDVTLTFRNAGEAEFSALIVPATGYYADAAPAGTKEQAAETAAGAEGEMGEPGAAAEPGAAEEAAAGAEEAAAGEGAAGEVEPGAEGAGVEPANETGTAGEEGP